MTVPTRKQITIDGNEAAAYVAYRFSEVIAIYPITPSSTMGELADEWNSAGIKNLWGTVPLVQEMQSESGAIGAIHGALQTGVLSTTFTASQGLLLMIPNLYKIAGELTPAVFHVAARTVATHALSIFGDHSDVMAVRATGFAMLSSTSVQEAMDFALIAHAATLEARIPFLHFFDGFRTSHEIAKIEQLTEDDLRSLVDERLIQAHRERALSPEHPVVRGTAQNPDVFFQSREAANLFHQACPGIVQKMMDKFAQLTGRQYDLFEYYGAADAKHVVVIMGSGAETVQETVDALNASGESTGVLKVRLYRPFSIEAFLEALPNSVRSIAVLDRTKEAGSSGEPLYLDVVNALFEARAQFTPLPMVIGGRYGLSSREFTPAMVKAVFDELKKDSPKNHFTVGITDDVSRTSLEYSEDFSIESPDTVRALFYGLGSDGTVSANKSSIKIIGENTRNFAQGYFVYDSKKSGSVTISHLRFGPRPIRSPYLITRANFLGCHQFNFLDRYDVLKNIESGGTFLLDSPFGADQVWDHLPRKVQETIIDKRLKFFVIDAGSVARATGMGGRINTIMQTCFFAISNVLPHSEAIALIKDSIRKFYTKKGEEIVQMNYRAVDEALVHLHEVRVPAQASAGKKIPNAWFAQAPEFVQNVTSCMISQCGDAIPVSALPVDGTYPVGTTKFEKRNIAAEVPVWEKDLCIQCGKCVFVCPHSVIRSKVYEPKYLDDSPATFKAMAAKDREFQGLQYTLQVSVEDCTGCSLCVEVCPARNKSEARIKAINMTPYTDGQNEDAKNWEHFLAIPDMARERLKTNSVRGLQGIRPLFEFSGACAGCGETPYLKLLSQLFGERALIANATGCSSIYGGNLPTTPWSKNDEGRGPAWANSLFEDNAEFGLGFRLSIDKQKEMAAEYVKLLESEIGTQLVEELVNADQSDEAGIFEQRQRVELLKEKLNKMDRPEAKRLFGFVDALVKKSIWIVGGDGWAYDIGFGGLDHVLSTGRDVNVLVLDTEVYSNTGGQMSKSTPRGAVAKFAASGKTLAKKDLARMMMTYGHVYIASVAFGAKDEHTVQAFLEAEAYPGPSLIIAYSHCIAHGIDMKTGLQDHKAAVQTGYWPLFRYNPLLAYDGKNPLLLDSSEPKIPLHEYAYRQNRFKMLTKSKPQEAKRLLELSQQDVQKRWKILESMAAPVDSPKTPTQ